MDRGGYVRFRRWRRHGEHGLAKQRAAMTLIRERLLLSHSDEPLAQDASTYAANGRHFAAVREEQLFVTALQLPRPPPWEPSPGEWQRALALPAPLPRQPRRLPLGEPPALFALAD